MVARNAPLNNKIIPFPFAGDPLLDMAIEAEAIAGSYRDLIAGEFTRYRDLGLSNYELLKCFGQAKKYLGSIEEFARHCRKIYGQYPDDSEEMRGAIEIVRPKLISIYEKVGTMIIQASQVAEDYHRLRRPRRSA